MNMKIFTTSAALALIAGGAMAQAVDPARVEVFRSVLQSNNCTLAENAAAEILPRFNFTRVETRAIVGALVASGVVELDGRTLNLVDGSCGPDNSVAGLLGQADVQQFIAVMAENNCAMTEAEGEAIFTARGMTKAEVGAIVGPMIQAGMASFQNGILSVESAYCSAPVLAEETPSAEAPSGTELDRSGMFGMSRVRQLVDAMAGNNCTLNMETAEPFLAEAGIEHGFAAFIGRKMIADGYAAMVDAENMQLAAPYCISSGPISAPPATTPPAVTPVDTPVQTAPAAMAEPETGALAGFYAVAGQNGCTLNINTAESALGAAGVRMDQAYRIVDDLVAAGTARLTDNGQLVSLDAALCAQQGAQPVAQTPTTPATPAQPAVAQNDPRTAVLAMLAANGCTVTQAGAADMVAAAGLDFVSSMRVLTQMMSSGEATSPDGGQTLNIAAPLCVAAGVEPMTPREAFIDLLKQNNCSVTAAQFGNLLPANGLDATTAFGMISELEAEGVISLPATRDVVTLSAEMCR